MISRNDPCWCGSGKKWKKCHYPEKQDPKNNVRREKYHEDFGILLKTPKQVEKIRAACILSRDILQKLIEKAEKGVTTNELNDLSNELHKKANAKPAAYHYGSPPYPKGICTSLNEVICHGIPDDRPLEVGDIMNIDVSAILDGYYGDLSKMVVIGKTDPERQLVVDVSYDAMMKAIEILRPGIAISEIGRTIEDYATSKGCSVVNQFVGHGVGVDFHEPPQVCHHYNDDPLILVPGMTFTIEPMINAGKREAVIDPTDKWTARTVDGKPSAQWEHTVLITDSGYEILTI